MQHIVAPVHARTQAPKAEVRRWRRGLLGGVGVTILVLLVLATKSPHTRTLLAIRRSSMAAEQMPPHAPVQELSEADLFLRKGAAEDIVKAQNAQKAAAVVFVQAVSEETRATREMSERAQYDPGSMADSRQAKAVLDANEAEIKRLGDKARTAGQTQVAASAAYVAANQDRYSAVSALQAELAQEAQAAYEIKAAVVGTAPGRFDPTSEGATTYNSAKPIRDKYHVAMLRGVDTDGSKSLCGRVEVYHDNEWGGICYKGFSPASAQTFCKTMGLTGGTARYYDSMGRPTWDDSVITNADASDQPSTSVIWMSHVKCTGSETNILACPFGETSETQDWKKHTIENSGCGKASGVALCCDVSMFCPPRSSWRPDPQDFNHLGQTYGDMMRPDQTAPDMVGNCKCDAGFYMETSSVYSGKCTTCPINSCSPVGSTSLNDCTCLEGFYKSGTANGFECTACPANSCSARGINDVSGCKCFAGYYMSGGQCVMCPEATTSKAGSTTATECNMLCGLPDSSKVLQQSEVVANAAYAIADAVSGKRAAADRFVEACEEETAALDELNTEMTYSPPDTLSPDSVASYSGDVSALSTDQNIMDKYGPIVKTSGIKQQKATEDYLAEGDKLRGEVVTLQGAFEDQLEKHHHIKEAVTRCQPTVACVPSPCEEPEPSHPCEPWPSCYPHPCQPWPSCSHDMLEAGRSEAEAEDDVDKQLEAYDKAAGFNVDKSPPDFFLAGA